MAESGCLKDGHFHNLQVENSVIAKKNCMSVNTSAVLTKNDCGIIFLDGPTEPTADLTETVYIRLPPPETGLHFKFILNGSATTSAFYQINASHNASFTGNLNCSDTSALLYTEAAPTILFKNDSKPGDHVDLTCYVDVTNDIKKWHTSGQVHGDGAAAGVFFGA